MIMKTNIQVKLQDIQRFIASRNYAAWMTPPKESKTTTDGATDLSFRGECSS